MAAAIKQANDTMGLPSQGPLPQQVAALVAALGIRGEVESARAAAR